MNIRCEKCDKLFRVADEKITGRGIKFSCTRCGDTVKITREDFNTYTLAKTAVSALDMFEPKPIPEGSQILEPDKAPAAEKELAMDAVNVEAPLPISKNLEPSSSDIPDFLQEEKVPIFSEPNHSFKDLPIADAPQPEQTPLRELEQTIKIPGGLESEQETGASMELEKRSEQEHHSEPTVEPSPQLIREEEHKMTPALDLVPIPKPESKSQPKSGKTRELEPKSTSEQLSAEITPSFPEEEPFESVIEPIDRGVSQTKPSHNIRMVIILMSTFILLGVAGYGVYKFILPSMQNAEQPAAEMTSIDGLQIVNPSGSVEPNGDLLITGSVENLTDKERSEWYVIVDVYDAKGNVLNKIRLLNGKQIYSRADYDILSKRGVNVAELKSKILQNQGDIIPAKGSVSFELRYIQPPIGMASFNAVLQPFDPIRLHKEIAEETK